MSFPRLFALAFAAGLVISPPAPAQDSMGIVAIVNEDPITQIDLATRMRIAIVASRLQDTPEVRQRLAPQVLRALIDEQIRVQEADRQGITIPERAISERIDSLAEDNKMSREQFEQMLAQNGIPLQSLKSQIKSEIAWSTVVRRKFQSGIVITAEDIAEARTRIIESQGEPEYLLAEIFLAADDATDSSEAEDAARRLMEELKTGAQFSAVARQFSQASTAPRGGDLGWVQAGDLSPELAAAVRELNTGEVAGPIRSDGGFHILLLRDRRESVGTVATGTVDMKQVELQLEAGATPAQVADAAESLRSLREQIASCDDVAEAGAGIDALTGDLTGMDVTALPGNLQSIAVGQPVGQASEPIRNEDGIAAYVVCARNLSTSGPSDQELRDQLVRERLDLMARGYLRDLRRTSFVDIRG
ncbi:MAG: peptidylprolyl isomerase [Dongiaceae bacterium]